MKSAAGWQDVAIHNVSAHGMKISVAAPPPRGAYIELRRASQVIVARTIWVQGLECGLRTQDAIDIAALVNPAATRAEAVGREIAQAERRRAPRAGESAARSARFAARFQYAAIAAAILAAAGYATWVVSDTLSRPFDSIGAALGGEAEHHGAAPGSVE